MDTVTDADTDTDIYTNTEKDIKRFRCWIWFRDD
jgi:hypothetical protein